MPLLRHSIEIATTLDAAFKICVDVEKWPEYFQPCKKAKIVKQVNNKQIIEIIADANGHEMTWQSERDIDPNTHTIHFRQVKPSLLLKKMEGAWRFDQVNEGVVISLEHLFEVHDVVDGIIENVNTKEDAISYMEKCIHRNSQRELNAIKEILEKINLPSCDKSHEFEETMDIPLSAIEVFSLLKNISRWPELLPHCNDIEVIYDDGIDQEFYMKVDVKGKSETIRSIRHCYAPYLIKYFQPSPPPVLKKHVGSWRIKSVDQNKTLLTSYHFIEINPEKINQLWGEITHREAITRVETAIKNNCRMTMQSIAKTAIL